MEKKDEDNLKNILYNCHGYAGQSAGFVIYARNHPEEAFPWDNTITYIIKTDMQLMIKRQLEK